MRHKELIFGKGGKPFAQKEEAFAYLIDNKKMDYTIIKHGGGWALAHSDTLMPEEEEVAPSAPMTYRKVRFQPRTNATDPKKISISVNDLCYVISRGVDVILPQSHLEVADNACYTNHYYDDQTNEMVNGGLVSRYPYSNICESTKEEFEAFKNAGNAQQKRELNKTS